MPSPASPISVQPSSVAALAVPLLAFVAGLASEPAASATSGPHGLAQVVFLVLLGAAACAWLWLDARERKHALHPVYFAGLLLAPVVAVPFYFNRTRERSERARANLWFIVISVSTVVALWLGAFSASGAK